MTLSPGQGGDITLRRVGPHRVTVTPGATNAPKTVGFTQGNLAITITPNVREVYVAEYGTTPADIEITGVKFSAKFTMVESSLKTLDIALSGIHAGNAFNDSILARGIGRSGVKRVQPGVNGGFGCELLLHPLAEGSGTGRDVTIWNALVTPSGDWELSDQGDMLIPVQAEGVVSTAEADGQLLALIAEYNQGA
ncbi:MAG: hypothetical protein KGL39_16290 [Patescibacteria group bacterium]|nr:hypothetical protein [Patescibacteria group bacterium]